MDASLYRKIFVEEYCDIAAFALIFFEYIITIDREIASIWNRKLTGATVLFILNSQSRTRGSYLSRRIVNQTLIAVPLMQLQSGQYFGYDVRATALLRMAIILDSTRLRNLSPELAYSAPRCRARVHAVGIKYLSLHTRFNGELSVANWMLFGLNSIPANIDNRSAKPATAVLIATRTSAILTDVLVLITTWWQTYSLRRLAVQANMQVSLATLLVRDGTIYFLVLLAMNTFHIAFSLTGRFTYTITFEEPLTTILISRFLLNLREASMSTGQLSIDMSEPSFIRRPPQEEEGALNVVASFIAPLGAFLDHSVEPVCEDVDPPRVDDP
ncbi:hypothetical protein NUW54_g1035 [Trametes sanguinea]|uniref:Uncharacterized protein n=1 Tax=Trametes sanguinea TaxID=158606 RepID=A0ACC1Q824_9APHY|nr:hypothetical protein NUW54_g1035 [Trametes sanguinea]